MTKRNLQVVNADEVKEALKSNLLKSGCGCDVPIFSFRKVDQTIEGRIRPCYKRSKNDRARCAHIHSYTKAGEDVVIAIRMSSMIWQTVANTDNPLWGEWIRITFKGREPTAFGHYKNIFLIEVDKGTITKKFESVSVKYRKSRKPRKRRPVCSSGKTF